jgi:glycosyltransferase involved in cell wall biosynthesis
MLNTVYRNVARLPRDHPLRRSGRFVRRNPWIRDGTDRLLRMIRRTVDFSADGRRFFRELLDCAQEAGIGAAAVPRRVIILNNGLGPGGAERQIVNTLRGLKDQPLVSVTFLDQDNPAEGDPADRHFREAEVEAAGISIARLPKHSELGWRYRPRLDSRLRGLIARLPFDLESEILDLAAELRERRPEVVHAWLDATAIVCGVAGLIAGVPRIVLATRSLRPTYFPFYKPHMRPAYQALAERPQIIFANNSEAGAADYCEWLGLPRARFRVVRNGVALDGLRRDPEGARALREREGIPPDAPVVGSIIRFSEEKRPMLWLDIAARLNRARPRTHFLIVGYGPLEPEMRRFIAAQPSREAFRLVAPTTAIGTALSAMNAFLLTSRVEGTPNVVLEAQWLGLPVVATPAGGVAETIAEGETGILCVDDSPETVAAQLCRILDDPAWATRAAATGPRFVRDRFGPERMIAETMALYGFADG